MTGFVYAVESGALVKIGYSEKPRLRLSKINSDASGPCRLIGYVAATRAQEKELHGLLAPQLAYGEWFRCEGPVEHFVSVIPNPQPPHRGRQRKAPGAADHPIAQYRADAKLTLSELGARIGLAKSQMSRIENSIQPIHALKAIAIEAATKGAIPRWKLRPDLWAPPPGDRPPDPLPKSVADGLGNSDGTGSEDKAIAGGAR